MKKILYIANPESIHDLKWISFFSIQPEEFTCYLLSETEQKISLETKAKLKKLNIHLLPQIDSFSIKRPLRTWYSIVQLRRHVNTIKPDFIHVLFASPFALWINYISSSSIITLRGSDILKVIPSLLEQKGLKKYYFHWLYRKFEQAFRKAEFVTCTSKTQLVKVQELFPYTTVHLIRTGIDIDRINSVSKGDLPLDLPDDKKIVLSPRYFSPIYNIELQLKAIALMDRDFLSSLYFIFIRGNNFDQDYNIHITKELEKLKEIKGLNYQIVDQLDQENLWKLFLHSDLCVMTPLSDGTPNTALEAMATRTPLIVPPLAYDEQLFSETCVHLEHYDANELARCITYCLTNYDPKLLDLAWQAVNTHGNRNHEMLKLERLIQQLKN